jgi:hypothetical protein
LFLYSYAWYVCYVRTTNQTISRNPVIQTENEEPNLERERERREREREGNEGEKRVQTVERESQSKQ